MLVGESRRFVEKDDLAKRSHNLLVLALKHGFLVWIIDVLVRPAVAQAQAFLHGPRNQGVGVQTDGRFDFLSGFCPRFQKSSRI